MKRILFAYPEVAPLFLNGGIGSFVFEAATLLAGSGRWEVDVLTDTSYGGGSMRDAFDHAQATFRSRGVRLIDLERGRSPFPTVRAPALERAGRYYAHVSRLHRERRYHVIETPDWQAPGFWLLHRKRVRGEFQDTTLVVHLHSSTHDVDRWNGQVMGGPGRRVARFMEDSVTAGADVIVSPSECLLRPLRERAVDRPLLRCGYPLASFDSGGPPPTRDRGSISIVCVGRLEPRKGQDLLARVAARLLDDPSLPPLQVSFCGRDNFGIPPDDRMSDTVRRILGRRRGWAILPPREREEVRRWLASEVDICVVPSRGDNYPNVVLEAAQTGCQVVCSDAGGLPDLLADYETGAFVFPAGDEAVLERQLTRAIWTFAADPGVRDRIAAAFEASRQAHAERFLAHYAALAGLRQPPANERESRGGTTTGGGSFSGEVTAGVSEAEVLEHLRRLASQEAADGPAIPSWRMVSRATRKLLARAMERVRRARWRRQAVGGGRSGPENRRGRIDPLRGDPVDPPRVTEEPADPGASGKSPPARHAAGERRGR